MWPISAGHGETWSGGNAASLVTTLGEDNSLTFSPTSSFGLWVKLN